MQRSALLRNKRSLPESGNSKHIMQVSTVNSNLLNFFIKKYIGMFTFTVFCEDRNQRSAQSSPTAVIAE